MNIRRKLLTAIALVTVLPLLVAYYLSGHSVSLAFYNKELITFITVFIAALGAFTLFKFINLLAQSHKVINAIAQGNFNQQLDIPGANDTQHLVFSINQVVQKLRQSTDELEKRAILIDRSNQELKRTNEIRTDFLADVVHELRTPLINIEKSSAFLLEDNGVADKPRRDLLNIINTNAKRLGRLVTELLDISKIEAGELVIRYKQFDVNGAIQEAINSVKNWSLSKELNIEIKIAPNLPNVNADRDRIIQVIINLLSNAIKFTPPRETIVVEAGLFNRDVQDTVIKQNGEPFMFVAVKNPGKSIEESQKQIIFERYKTKRTDSYSEAMSTGLGLPIAKHIVQKHGGKIWVESQPGSKTRFVFIIPVREQKQPETAAVPTPGLNKRILVIDDEINIRELLRQALGKKGYVVNTAENGFDAIKQALRHHYDLVITDMRMPMMGGANCIKILKKLHPDTSFIVITAFPIEASLEADLKKENCPYIRKPFDLRQLLLTVDESCIVSREN